MSAESITCPKCKKTSYNPNDIAHGYCGFCHDWTSLDDAEPDWPIVCKECTEGKHPNCDTTAWSNSADDYTMCGCHMRGHVQ